MASVALLLIIVGIPITYFAATNNSGLTTNTQHASGPSMQDVPSHSFTDTNPLGDLNAIPYNLGCSAWKNHERDVILPNAHLYIHLYELYNPTFNSSCNQFYQSADIDIAPNLPASVAALILADNNTQFDKLQYFAPATQNWWSFQKRFIHLGPSSTFSASCSNGLNVLLSFGQPGFPTANYAATCNN